MFYGYFLKSVNFDFYYKGHCEDLVERLKQHNAGMTLSAKRYVPFKIVYTEGLRQEKKRFSAKDILRLLREEDF